MNEQSVTELGKVGRNGEDEFWQSGSMGESALQTSGKAGPGPGAATAAGQSCGTRPGLLTT